MISPEDWDNLHVTDDPEEAVRLVVAGYERRQGLTGSRAAARLSGGRALRGAKPQGSDCGTLHEELGGADPPNGARHG